MNATKIFSRAISAVFALFLVTALTMAQSLNLTGAGGTMSGTWNVKADINTASATGLYTFDGTVNLNGTGATLVQTIASGGGATATKALVFANLNAGTAGATAKAIAQGGIVTVNTAFVLNTGAAPASGQSYVVGTNTLNLGGTTSVTGGVFDANSTSSVVNYTSASTQTVLASTYAGTLGLSGGSAAKDFSGNTNAATVTTTGTTPVTLNHNLTITGTSLSTFDAVTLNSGTVLDVQGTGGATIAGTVTNTQGTIQKTTGAGTITFSTDLTTAGIVTASAGTLTFSGNATAATNGTISLTGAAVANFAKNLTTTGTGSLSFNAGTATVNLTGGTAQSITAPVSFYDVAMSGAGVKTFTGSAQTITIGHQLDNASATTDFGDNVLSGGTYTQASGGTVKFGGASNGKVFAAGTVEYNGLNSVTQVVTAGTYANLTLTNGTGSGTATKQVASGATVHTTAALLDNSGSTLALVDGTSILNVDGAFTLNGALTNPGQVTVLGDFNVNGAVTNTGTINVGQ